MNPEIEEHRIVEIIRRVSAENGVKAIVVPRDQDDETAFNVGVDFVYEFNLRNMKTVTAGLLGCSIGAFLGATARGDVSLAIFCGWLLVASGALFWYVRVLGIRRITHPALQEKIHAELTRRGYEIVDDPTCNYVRIDWSGRHDN